MNLYITEKPSVARIIKDYLNNSGANFKSTATNKKTDSPFFFDSNGNCIAWCTGHLLRLLDPKEYDPKYASWDETLLPIYPEELKKCTDVYKRQVIDVTIPEKVLYARSLYSKNVVNTVG